MPHTSKRDQYSVSEFGVRKCGLLTKKRQLKNKRGGRSKASTDLP